MCVCIGSSIGKVGMTSKDASATNQQINSIICNNKHNPTFIYYLLSYFAEYWRGFATFGPVPILSKGAFEAIHIVVPPTKDEETEIADCFRALDAKAEVHMRRKVLLADLFRTLLNQLMTAHLRVHDLDLDNLECILERGDVSPLSEGVTRRADQSADSSAHSKKENGDTSPHVTIHKVK
jgi:type I restriction enzyme S subunit